MAELRVHIQGAGKVGRALARALRAKGAHVTLRAAREGLPKRALDVDLVIVAVRDGDVPKVAEGLAAGLLPGERRRVAVVHCAGALGPEALAAVRGPRVAVAQMHPMIAFADSATSPSLEAGQLHVDGDAHAVRVARRVGRLLGLTPRTIPGLDRVAYHAAAGLVANGAAALAAAGIELLEKAGVPRETAAAMLGPLLRSVAENVTSLGMPRALTGPVRRGDLRGLERHVATLERLAPQLVPLYLASAGAQLPHARALGEAPAEALDGIAALVARAALGPA
jgi:predicted short-subunit dehydrogenase-like oxidoreductase (DUF2520 family)